MIGTFAAHDLLLRQVARRLSADAPLSSADVAVIERLQGEATVHRRGADVTPLTLKGPMIITTGWACEMRALAKGGRQIFRFLIPGDFVGSFWPHSPDEGCRIQALTRVGLIAADGLMTRDGAGAPTHRAVLEAARRAEDKARSLLFDHIVRLGARDAYCGLSHLLLELHERCLRAGLAQDGGFPLPIGQRVLAQAMGLTPAHVNHTLQRMTADGLIAAGEQTMRLLQPERMARLSHYATPEPAGPSLAQS